MGLKVSTIPSVRRRRALRFLEQPGKGLARNTESCTRADALNLAGDLIFDSWLTLINKAEFQPLIIENPLLIFRSKNNYQVPV